MITRIYTSKGNSRNDEKDSLEVTFCVMRELNGVEVEEINEAVRTLEKYILEEKEENE